jgi:hypothetical protein
MISSLAVWPEHWTKFRLIFVKNVAKDDKISTSELNFKAQNIHIKLLLKPYNKPWVETACLGEN